VSEVYYWCRECVRPCITLERIQNIVNQRGGVCFSSVCDGKNSKLKLQCSKGHTWETRAINISCGYWCNICSQNERLERIRKLAFEEIQRQASLRGGRCLSTEYTHYKAKLEWECGNGHTWSECASFSFGRKYWCKEYGSKCVRKG